MLIAKCSTHTRILTELPPKLNLTSNCESLLLGIQSGMSCELSSEGAERTRWKRERQMENGSDAGGPFWVWFTDVT